jgi:hypothetical protein
MVVIKRQIMDLENKHKNTHFFKMQIKFNLFSIIL